MSQSDNKKYGGQRVDATRPAVTKSKLYAEIEDRFGVLPNLFKLPPGFPEITANLWDFTQQAYLNNPLPSLFKERLFVYLSRFCKERYCITRHLGFLIGLGRVAGDASVPPQSIAEVMSLLEHKLPRKERLDLFIQQLNAAPSPLAGMLASDSATELTIFTCAAHIFLQSADAPKCDDALRHALRETDYQHLLLFLTFVRTAHYWSEVQPDLHFDDDIEELLATHKHLAELLLHDPEATAFEINKALMSELEALRTEKQRVEKLLSDEQFLRQKREAVLLGENKELLDKVARLEKATEEIRTSRRAALNLMEDAVLSREALRQSEERYRTKLEHDVFDRTAELQASKELLQATIDSSLDVIQVFRAVRDENNKVVDFIWIMNNTRGTKQNGNVIGESLISKNPGIINSGVFDRMVQVVETEVSFEGEQYYNYEQFDGWFYQALVKSGDGVMMTTRDITHQKKADQEIMRLKDEIARTATDKYHSLFNSIDEGFCIIEVVFDGNKKPLDYRFIETNPVFIKQTGLEDAIGKTMKELAPAHEEFWFEAYGEVALTGEPKRFEHFASALAGGVWYDVYAFRVDLREQHHVALLFNDITGRKKVEEELAKDLEDTKKLQQISTRLIEEDNIQA